MHNHSNNSSGGHDSKMMWLMMLACFVPIIFLAFTGGVGRNSIWWLLGAGAVMLGLHAFAMRGHGSHSHKDDTDAGAVGTQPAVPPATSKTDAGIQPSVVDSGATKDHHKHGCC